jgi:hypothetical protein
MSEQLQGEDEMTGLTLTVPEELLLQFEDLARCAVADALTAHRQTADEGFLDVDGAAAFLASTPAAIRSLVSGASSRSTKHRTVDCCSFGGNSIPGCALANARAP